MPVIVIAGIVTVAVTAGSVITIVASLYTPTASVLTPFIVQLVGIAEPSVALVSVNGAVVFQAVNTVVGVTCKPTIHVPTEPFGKVNTLPALVIGQLPDVVGDGK